MTLVQSRLLFFITAAAVLLAAAATDLHAATTGTITGVVTDAKTGQPLGGVNIQVQGLPLTTVTDDHGYYSITNVPPGHYDVIASLIGYAPAKAANVGVLMDLQSAVNVKLTPTVEEQPEVVVVEQSQLIHPEATQNMYVRTGEDQVLAKSQPNSFYQVPSLVSSVPGVVQDASGNLHIRGGRNDEIGWMIEGIPVTNPIDNTFGTNLVTVGMSRMEVYTGGYQAEYGNAISGVLNEIKNTGSDIKGGRFESTLGSEGHADIYAEAGNVLPNGLDWYVGNYTWRTDFERYVATSANSSDSVLKTVYPMGSKDRITFLGMTGSAEYKLPVVSSPPYQDQNRTNQAYSLAGLTWSHQMSADMYWLVRPYYFQTTNEIRALSTSLDDSSESTSVQHGLQAQVVKKIKDKHEITAGAWYTSSGNRFHRFIPDLASKYGFGGIDPTLPAQLDPFAYTSSVGTRQVALFAQDKIRLSKTLVMDAGVRYDKMRYKEVAYPNRTDSQFSPRVGFAWSRNPRTVIRASFGRFIQFVPTEVLDRVYTNSKWAAVFTPNSTMQPERATSYEVSWEHQVSADAVVRITPFYRDYTDLIDRVYQNAPDPSLNLPFPPLVFANADEAKAYGAEVYLERKMGPHTRGWISYTFSHTKATSLNNPGIWTYVDWDQRHTLDTTLEQKMGLTELSMRMQYGSGLPWSNGNDPQPDMRRLSAYAVFSLGVKRPLGPKPFDGSISLNIYNVFNTATVTSRDQSGVAQSYILPRFIGVTYSRKL